MKILAVFGRNAYGDAARGEGYEHANILPDLKAIAAPDEVRLFDSWDRSATPSYAKLNIELLAEIAAFQPAFIFLVLMTHEIWTETLECIRHNSPAVVVNWGTDDSWKYRQCSRFIAPHVDLHVTTDEQSLVTAERIDRLTNVALSQWAACSTNLRAPISSAQCRYDVNFLGANYGNRANWIAQLASRGIAVRCFGKGWENGVVATRDIPEIFQQSRVSLNFSDSGLQLIEGKLKRSRQIKARTFEVPGSGGFLLTEPANRLETYFDLDRDIATFANPDELAAKIRYFLANPEERDAMAYRAYVRTKRDHTYKARLPGLFAQADKNAKTTRGSQAWSLNAPQLDPAIKTHTTGPLLESAATALGTFCKLTLGASKGQRAARRFAHELSWRITGARTYSAGGVPGRLHDRDL